MFLIGVFTFLDMVLTCRVFWGVEGVAVILAVFPAVFVTLPLRVEVPLLTGFLALPLDAPVLELPSPLL